MPSIVATPYPTRGQVLLEVSMADVPGATHVCVEAITGLGTTTETRRQLHPYVSYNSNGCEALSCGQAIFWDTEILCDIPTQYCATAINASGTVIMTAMTPFIKDTFTRTVSNGWGTADIGGTWTIRAGTVADFSTNGTRGLMRHAAVNAVHRITVDGSLLNVEAYTVFFPTVVATGAAIEQNLLVRRSSEADNTDFRASILWNTGGTVTLNVQKVVAGVTTTLQTASVGTYTATSGYAVRFRVWGNQLTATAWDVTIPEPSTPSIPTFTDNSVTMAGFVGFRSILQAGNTNPLNVTLQFDDLLVTDPCDTLMPVQACTEPVTIACDGCFRLGDPVRPCNDVRVCLCADGVNCGQTPGLFFAGMTADTYAANSASILPVNGKYPIVVNRTRRASTGQFDIVATSFTQRDALLALLAPGSPLLWRGPANFGTGNRYISVGDVPVAPQIADLTIQPRLISLPFVETKGPVGPTQGVCGARVQDLCQVYATWDAMVAAGLTWADLLRGNASTTPSGLATWADINAQNADWNTLLVNEPDWNDVVDGD